MAEAAIHFRAPNSETYKAAATRRGLRLSDWLREAADTALKAEGFSTGSVAQYALVADGGLVIGADGGPETILSERKPLRDERGEWWPIENRDSAPFDAAQHWRLKPLPLRVDGEVVVREYPVIAKCQEHA